MSFLPIMFHTCSIGERSEDLAGHSNILTLASSNLSCYVETGIILLEAAAGLRAAGDMEEYGVPPPHQHDAERLILLP